MSLPMCGPIAPNMCGADCPAMKRATADRLLGPPGSIGSGWIGSGWPEKPEQCSKRDAQ